MDHLSPNQESDLEAACRAANNDEALNREIDEWQAFDDVSHLRRALQEGEESGFTSYALDELLEELDKEDG